MRLRAWIAAGALLGAGAVTAAAQPAPRHQGFNFALGFGMGKISTSCTTCSLVAKERGWLANLRVGTTLHDQLLLVLDGTFYEKQQTDSRGDAANTDYQIGTLDAIIYPARRWDTFLKLGAGLGHLAEKLDTQGGLRDIRATMPVIRFGAGTDLRLGRTWSLSPYVDYVLAIKANTNVDGVQTKANMLLFGATVTWP